MPSAPEPHVAVVIPTHFRNDRLQAAIESALAQDHEPAEVLVVDDSGQAHARDVVDAYPDVDYLAHERNEGAHAARSHGAERVEAAFIQFLDDDDRLHPEKWTRQLPLFDEDTSVVYAGLADESFGEVRPDPEVQGDVLERTLAMNTMPCIPSTMLVDADLVDELLPFRHRHGADDTGWKIELAKRTRFAFVDETLVDRGDPEDPVSRSWAHIEGRKHLLDVYADLYEQVDPTIRRTALRQTLYRQGVKRLEERPYAPRAILDLARALRHTPEDRPRFARHLLGSLLGRPGLRWARRFD